MLFKYMHNLFDNIHTRRIDVDLLSHLEKYQNENDKYLNNMLVIPSILEKYDAEGLAAARKRLVECGYAIQHNHMKSQLAITDLGRCYLRRFNQFQSLGIPRKFTWWVKNCIEGFWKIVWILIMTISISLNFVIYRNEIGVILENAATFVKSTLAMD